MRARTPDFGTRSTRRTVRRGKRTRPTTTTDTASRTIEETARGSITQANVGASTGSLRRVFLKCKAEKGADGATTRMGARKSTTTTGAVGPRPRSVQFERADHER